MGLARWGQYGMRYGRAYFAFWRDAVIFAHVLSRAMLICSIHCLEILLIRSKIGWEHVSYNRQTASGGWAGER
jgi:hypothetical protein